MSRKKDRKYFFIKSFLLVMLAVAVSEIILNTIYTTWLYPFLRETLHWEIFIVENNSDSAFYSIFSLFSWFFLQGILTFLPNFIAIPLQTYLARYMQNTVRIEIDEYFAGYPEWFVGVYCLLCITILIIVFAVLVLPYVIGAIVYSRIINRELNQILEEEKQQRQEFDRKRSLMISDIAHDLKTPITTISGYAQAISEGVVKEPEKQKEYLEAITRKSSQMNELIQLLYEYVKLDSEGFVLKKENTDIGEFLRECVVSVYSDLEERQIELEMDIPEEKIYYELDRMEFGRAVNNLLNNALQHNPPGIRLIVQMRKTGAGDWKVIIGDSGVRIPAEIAKNIFDPFVLGDASRNSKNGSGLGTSISHKIVAMHGWELELEEKGNGEYTKAFIITLSK